VISVFLAKSLKEFVKLREQLVRKYDEFDESLLKNYIQEADLFQTFLDHVHSFLHKEKENGNLYV
jgi:uncharacterized protein YutE (UPF0331/DUF86 family)